MSLLGLLLPEFQHEQCRVVNILTDKKYKVVAILGLNCGLVVFRLLKEMASIELVAVFARSPGFGNGIAGYIDLSQYVEADIHKTYDSVDEINSYLKEIGFIDLIVGIGISDILRGEVLTKPHLGCLGAHAAPLPSRPGSAPIVWAILDGLEETAMTIFQMTERIDEGPIFGVEPVPIESNETGQSLRLKMDEALLRLLRRCLPEILSGANNGQTVEGERYYTRRRGPKDGELSLNAPGNKILRKIRALSAPYPGAHFFAGDGTPIVIEQARKGDKTLYYERSHQRLGAQNNRRVLCVVAHPDDEALGLGGTLIKHSLAGDDTSVIILSEGETAKQQVSKNTNRLAAAEKFAKIAGVSLRAVHDLPDQALDTVPLVDIIQRLEKDIEDLAPTLVYIHHPGDINSDHQICAQAVLAALRPVRTKIAYPEILAFETPSSTDQAPHIGPYAFQPNHYVQIDDVWQLKLSALDAYREELQPTPHPRSLEAIESLSVKRGAEIGVAKAEAFVLVRRLWS